jgi:hypothetical protein
MKKFTIILLLSTIGLSSFAQLIDVRNANIVKQFMDGAVYSNLEIGAYGIIITYDYSSISNCHCLIAWNQATSKSDPVAEFINVTFTPKYGKCEIRGMNPRTGDDLILFLFPNGHLEFSDGTYFERND